MSRKNGKRRNKVLRVITPIGIAIAVIGILVMCYLNWHYEALPEARENLASTSSVNVYEEERYDVFEPVGEIKAGFIFYPGGQVEAEAYAPLMKELADNGIYAVLLKVPYDLAVLDIDAADDVYGLRSDITSWYIGGHSLGGYVAGEYLSKTDKSYAGLVLLGSYVTSDFSSGELKVLSMYGENDGVMNRKNYDKDISNLPSDMEEIVIPGGNHSYFGSYGVQRGDGDASIGNGEQIDITTKAIVAFIEN